VLTQYVMRLRHKWSKKLCRIEPFTRSALAHNGTPLLVDMAKIGKHEFLSIRVAGTRSSTLLVRMEDVVLHGHMARVSAI
jgi:hypothetical protein